MKKFVFICGAARSGTTPLRRLVCSHDDVAIGLERYIGKALGADFIDRGLFEKERFFDMHEGDTFYLSLEAYPYYADLESRYDSCKLFGDKIPRLYEFYKQLDARFAQPKVLFIVRNVFDVASSYNNRLAAGNHWGKNRDAKAAVADWNRSVQETLKNFDSSDILVVEHELLYTEKSNVQKIFYFLGLDFNAQVQATFNELVVMSRRLQAKKETSLSEEEKQYICLKSSFGIYRQLIERAQKEGRYVGARHTPPASD